MGDSVSLYAKCRKSCAEDEDLGLRYFSIADINGDKWFTVTINK